MLHTVKQDFHEIQDTQETHRSSSTHIGVSSFAAAYDLPLSRFLVWAQENYSSFHDGEVWQSPLWSFVRLVKGHPEMVGHSAGDALKVVERIMAAWKGKLNVDAWERYFFIPKEDGRVEFLSCWDKVRFIPGWEPLDQAVERAKQMRLQPRNERTDGYELFISIAGWLQVTMGDRNIMLPCTKLSEYLNCKPMTISRYRKWAVEDGLLKIVKEHRFKSEGGGEATEFRFDTSRYACLAVRAEKANAD